MTASDTPCGQPGAARGAVPFDSFDGITGTSGVKAALPADIGTQQDSIELDQADQDSAHFLASRFQCLARLCRKSAASAVTASRLTMATMSRAGNSCWFRRKFSRMIRRSRFLTTADPATFRDTAMPRRGPSRSLAAASRVKKRSDERKPSRNTRVKASDFSRRRWRGNRKRESSVGAGLTDRASPGPWRDGR